MPKPDDRTSLAVKMDKLELQRMLQVSSDCTSVSTQDLHTLVSSFHSELKPIDKDIGIKMKDKKVKAEKEQEKEKIKQRLIFFNSIYKEISEPKNSGPYFATMSDLLAYYIDLEVLTLKDAIPPDQRKSKSKESKRDKEDQERRMRELMSRIVSSLYTLLGKSEDHILDTVLKLNPQLSDDAAVIAKDVTDGVYASLYRYVAKRAQKRQINNLTYIRYVLVYALWKEIVKEEQKEEVIKLASSLLRPPPDFLKVRRTIPRVLPKPPKGCENITEFFLREQFNSRKRAKKFLSAASDAINQQTMFPNFMCNPRLLNPRKFGPLPQPNQEVLTNQGTTEEILVRFCCEEPCSISSVFEQVTNFKRPKQLTVTKVFKILRKHHLRDKARNAKNRMRRRNSSVLQFKKNNKVGLTNGASCRDTKRYEASDPKCNGRIGLKPSSKRASTTKLSSTKSNKRRKESPDGLNLAPLKSDSDGHIPADSCYIGNEPFKKDPVRSVAESPFSKSYRDETPVENLKGHVRCMVDASVSPIDPYLELKKETDWQLSPVHPVKPLIVDNVACSSVLPEPVKYPTENVFRRPQAIDNSQFSADLGIIVCKEPVRRCTENTVLSEEPVRTSVANTALSKDPSMMTVDGTVSVEPLSRDPEKKGVVENSVFLEPPCIKTDISQLEQPFDGPMWSSKEASAASPLNDDVDKWLSDYLLTYLVESSSTFG